MNLALNGSNYKTDNKGITVVIKLDGNSAADYDKERKVLVSREVVEAWKDKANAQTKSKELGKYKTYFCFEPREEFVIRPYKFGIENGEVEGFKDLMRSLDRTVEAPKRQIADTELYFMDKTLSLFKCTRKETSQNET